MPPSRSNRSRSESSQPKERSSGKKSSEHPEILHQLGRAVLAYSLKRMSGRDSSLSDSRSDGRHDRDSSRRSRSSAGQRDRGVERTSSRETGTRSDSSDLHHIMGQVAVGLVGYGVRQYLRQRKQSKQKAATAGQPRKPGQQEGNNRGWPGVGGWSKGATGGGNRPADPELAAALKSLSAELESTSRSIRRLTISTPSHKSCEVHERLKASADGIQGSIAGLQTCVNNIKNLHGGLERKRDVGEPSGGERARQRELEGGGGSSSSVRRTRERGESSRGGVDEGRHRSSSRMNRRDRGGRRR